MRQFPPLVSFLCGCVAFLAAFARGGSYPAIFLPEAPAPPLADRELSHGMTWFHLVDDEARTRHMLATLRDMGVRKSLALVYWWRWDTKDWDYAAHGYEPQHVNEAYRRAIDYYVDIALELGLQPCIRTGSFRVFQGLFHPADESGSVEPFAAWLEEVAARYRGRVHLWMLGDEENRGYDFGWSGTPEDYMNLFFRPAASAVRAGDPDVLIGTGSASSAPATDWFLETIALGLPEVADGISGNFSYNVIESRVEMEDLVRRVRAVWPEALFFGHAGYAENLEGLADRRQAGITAQSMFTTWDLGWHTSAYYLYHFSRTDDTRQNYGLLKSFGDGMEEPEVSAAWKAYQAMAQLFYNRSALLDATRLVRLRQADRLTAEDGFSFALAPPDPVTRAFIREDQSLLIYLACAHFNEPRDGAWEIVIQDRRWGDPRAVSLTEHTARLPLAHRWEEDALVIGPVSAGLEPAVLIAHRAAPGQVSGPMRLDMVLDPASEDPPWRLHVSNDPPGPEARGEEDGATGGYYRTIDTLDDPADSLYYTLDSLSFAPDFEAGFTFEARLRWYNGTIPGSHSLMVRSAGQGWLAVQPYYRYAGGWHLGLRVYTNNAGGHALIDLTDLYTPRQVDGAWQPTPWITLRMDIEGGQARIFVNNDQRLLVDLESLASHTTLAAFGDMSSGAAGKVDYDLVQFDGMASPLVPFTPRLVESTLGLSFFSPQGGLHLLESSDDPRHTNWTFTGYGIRTDEAWRTFFLPALPATQGVYRIRSVIP